MASRRKRPRRRQTQRANTYTDRAMLPLPSPLTIVAIVAALALLILLLSLPWYLSVAAAIMLFVAGRDGLLWWQARQQHALRAKAQAQTDIEHIWRMSGTEFEHWTADVLRGWCGWRDATVRGKSGDQGVDIIGHNARGERSIVQCKRWEKDVDIGVVQAILGSLSHHDAKRAYVITTSRISKNTKDWIGDKPVEVWDGNDLKQLINQHSVVDDVLQGTAAQLPANAWLPRFWKPLFGGLAAWCLLMIVLTSSWSLRATTRTTSDSATTPLLGANTTPNGTVAPLAAAVTTAEGAALLTSDTRVAREPNTTAPLILQLRAGEQVKPLARTADGAWLRVRSAFGIEGWLPTASISYSATLVQQLPVQ